jgi:glycosyltransferase involved in cell wall biosynthesis/SAM-dependent methyltransferase
MLDLRRLIMLEPRRDAHSRLTVRADLLGRVGDIAFGLDSHAAQIHGNGTAVLVDIEPDDKVYFTHPQVHGFKRAPKSGALAVEGGGRYIFSGSVEVLGGSQVSAVLVYFDANRKLGHRSALLTTGSFMIEATLPATAETAVLAFRVKGPGCFALHALTLAAVPWIDPVVDVTDDADAPAADGVGRRQANSVVMIVLNDIVHDGRVLKTARTLMDHGYDVTLFGMWRTQNSRLMATSIDGARALIFPNPTSFLRNAPVRALNWEHQIAYLRTTMWRHVEQAHPRFIHTHDYHTAPLGLEFARRLRDMGHTVHWLHDFHEYVAGYDHMEADWQDAILAHEDRAVRAMDHRFTVSPLIATWLEERYALAETPTVVLNTPSRRSLDIGFDRTVRRDLGLAPDLDLIVYTGGVSELRGLHTVVEALGTNPDWHFAVVTNNQGPYIARLQEMAAAGSCEDRLHFLPYVAPHQVAAYVRDASIGIMPFRRYGNTDASLPNKLYDYLHAGLPMAASNCTLIEEFLQRWQIGEVFEEENVRDCAATIARVLARQTQYRRNIRANSELLRESTWEEQSTKILDAYQSLEDHDRQAPAHKCLLTARAAAKVGREQGPEFYDGRLQRVMLPLEQSPWLDLYQMTLTLLPPGDVSIADLGCGTGRFAKLLQLNGYTRYLGIDFSARRIEEARSYVPSFRFEVGNVFDPDLRSLCRDCDVFVLTEVLEHIEDDRELIRSIPEGRLVVFSVPSFNSAGHVRRFEGHEQVRERYGDLLDFSQGRSLTNVRVRRPERRIFISSARSR